MGRVWKLHDDVNTDEIIPGRYNVTLDRTQLAKYCLCEVRPDFSPNVKQGDVVVGGRNFGCGSSREGAPIAIKAAGVSVVIAQSFARIFFRNSINIGLPVLICEELYGNVEEGDDLTVDPTSGKIRNERTGQEFQAQPLPEFVLKIAQAGGMINYIKQNGDLV